MQPLAPIAPRVVPGRAVDIPDVAPNRGVSRGFARIDLGEPVFPNHHVPVALLAAEPAGSELTVEQGGVL